MRAPVARAFVTVLLAAAVAATTLVAWEQRDGAGLVSRPALATSTLTGVVVEDDGGAAVRRAIVTVQSDGGEPPRSVPTDDNGRFAMHALPTGRYSVVARRAAYLDAAYGAKRPGRPGTAVSLDEGRSAEVTIRMTRGAVVEGTLRGPEGEPVPDTMVYAFSPGDPGTMGPVMFTNGQAMATTDDRGMYRIYGLVPGEYILASVFSPAGNGEIGRFADAMVDALLASLADRGNGPAGFSVGFDSLATEAPTVGYAPTYYPGTNVFSDATLVSVAAGEERRGLDFTLGPVATAAMEGVVAGDPARLAAVRLSFVTDGPRAFMAGSRPVLSEAPGPDGRFRYTSVPPGHYTIYARSDPAAPPRGAGVAVAGGGGVGGGRMSGPGAAPIGDPWFAVADVPVSGQDVSGIALVLQPGAAVSGRVGFDSASGPPADMSTLRVALHTPGAGSYMMSSGDGTMMGNAIVTPPAVTPDVDGAFVMAGVAPGTYELRTVTPFDADGRWWLRSAMLDGRDLLDEPLELRAQSLEGLTLTFTDRINELTGTFQTAAGTPAVDYYVVVLPADPALWRSGSRRFGSTRPGTDGRFSLTRLPAGDYLMAALTDFEAADLDDRSFLEAFARQGIAVTIRDGEQTVQDIKAAP